MRYRSTVLRTVVVGLLLTGVADCVVAAEQRTQIVAVSLDQAQQSAAKLRKAGLGMSELTGFIVDKKTGETIILGRASEVLPVLTLDDFVSLIRCAQTGGLSGPGMSLEPKNGDISGSQLEVVFFGGAGGTSLGKASFVSDYLMKKIALEKVPNNITGLKSYAALTRERFREDRTSEWNVLSRFWFAPIYNPLVMTAEEDMFLLKETQVGVIVQTISAEVNGKSAPDYTDGPAHKYAEAFTQLYDDVARVHVEFAHLRRFMGGLKVASLLLAHAPTESLKYWMGEYSAQKVTTPLEVELLRDVSADGRRQLTLVGGVRIAGLTLRLRGGELAAIRDAILLARPSKTSLTWTVSFDQDWRVSIPSASERDQKIARLFADALIQQEKGDDAGAVLSLDQVLQAYPDVMEAKFLRAVCARDAAIKSGKIEESLPPLTALRDLATAHPQFVEIPYEVGVTLRVLGRTDEAVDVLQKVIITRNDFAPAHHALGLAYLTRGDKDLAKQHLNEYLRLSAGGDNKYVQEVKRVLTEIETGKPLSSAGQAPVATFSDEENHFQCQYPGTWRSLKTKEAREILPEMKDVQNVVAAFMDPTKSDNNVNVQVVPFAAQSLTDEDVQDAIPELDAAYRARFRGFKKVEAGPVTINGIKGVRYVFTCDRAGVPIQQCVVTLVKDRRAYTITFTAQAADYPVVWEAHFKQMMSSFRLGAQQER